MFICWGRAFFVTLKAKVTDMSTIKIPHNGLPQEITSIPFGQVFVLTSPFLGITAKTIHMMEFVLSFAKDYGQSHNVNARSVQYSGLWDCSVCKVKTDKGVQLLISDKESLIEMLCEFWSLDYRSVCDSYVIPDRYKSYTLGGETHPVKVTISTPIKPAHSDKDDTIRLNFLQAHSRAEAYGNLKSTIIDNLNYGFGITLDEIIAVYKEEEQNRKTYTLDIHFEYKEVYEKGKPVNKIKDYSFILTDNKGVEYHYSPSVQPTAIYLTFMLFPAGLRIKQIAGNSEFYDTFKKIYLQLPYSSKSCLPKDFDNLSDTESNQYTLFLQKLGDIRDAIMDATNDNSAREKFAVEGNGDIPFRVAGATVELRAKIKEEFDLK